jgi:hypothetical protein
VYWGEHWLLQVCYRIRDVGIQQESSGIRGHQWSFKARRILVALTFKKNDRPHRHPPTGIPRMFAVPLLAKSLSAPPEEGRLRSHGLGFRWGRRDESEIVIREGGPDQTFINLSSIAAFVRQVFALNDIVAAIRISNIQIDQFPPEQKILRHDYSWLVANRRPLEATETT